MGFATGANDDSEAGMYKAAGAELADINWLHDNSEEALKQSGGATASFVFKSNSAVFGP